MLAAPCRRFALAATALCAAAPAAALTYALNDAGLEPPNWESGRSEIAVADVNGDGHLDLLSLGDHGNPLGLPQGEEGIMVWRGNGAFGWTYTHSGQIGYGGIAAGDLDGDGLADIAYGMHHNYGGSDFGDQLIEAARGDGSGLVWTPWDDGLASDGESYGMFGVVLFDADGDGDLDLACNSFGCCNGMHVYRNNHDGTWTPTWNSGGASSNSTEDICVGDVNADGFLDIAAGLSTGTVWVSDGAGHFTRADGNLPTFGTGARGPSLGDVTGDGRADLSWATSSGGVQVWAAGDTAHWTNISAGLPANGPFEATRLADMDGDGDLDLVAFGNGTFAVFLGNGAGGWANGARLTLPSPGVYAALSAPADLDHNGRPDVAIASTSGGNTNHLHLAREATVPAALAVTPVAPRAAETWRIGVVRDLEWLAAVPAGSGPTSVDLEWSVSGSAGPWMPIASGVPNAGRFQWAMPSIAPSESCFVRYTLHAGLETASAITQGAFRETGGPTAVQLVHGAATLAVEVTRAGNSWRARAATPVRWSVRDVRGRVVRSWNMTRELRWDGTDARGVRVASGTYVLQASDDGRVASARVVVTR